MNKKYRNSLKIVKENFRELTDIKKDEFGSFLYAKYTFEVIVSGNLVPFINTDIGKNDFKQHLNNRLLNYRQTVIPWLSSLLPMREKEILEIGCGSGASTIALAEQDCKLTSIDVDGERIKIAKKRCEIYDLSVNILEKNASHINDFHNKFDFIIFTASLEHMTYEERYQSIRFAWDMLRDSGFLVITGTPNRLFYYDSHSSLLPFYDWLPDEIAMKYSKYSPRERCVNIGFNEIDFLRFGRGVSYHEFELALDKRCKDLEIYSLHQFLNIPILSRFNRNTRKKFIEILKEVGPPGMSDGFYCPYLDIAIKKVKMKNVI